MKRIVLAGASAYGLDNLSDDCMLQVLCRQLKQRYPEAQLSLLARHPSQRVDDAFGAKSIKNLDHDVRPKKSSRWYYGFNPEDETEHLPRIRQELESADVLVISGAAFIDNISIGFMHGLIPYTAILVTLARFLGTEVQFNGLHMGRPLVTNEGRALTKYCLNLAQLITVRDESSLAILQTLTEPTCNLRVLADASFGLDAVNDESLIRAANTKAAVPRFEKKAVGITFRMLYWRWSDKDVQHYTSMLAKICDKIVTTLDRDVVLIPHNTYSGDKTYMDDRPGHNLIHSKCANKARVFPITNRLTTDETLAVYSQLIAVFSNRRHSAIWAVIQGVVPTATGEADHVRPPLDQLDIGSDLFLPLESINAETIFSTIEAAINNVDNILIHAKNKLIRLRELALSNADLNYKKPPLS